MTEDILEIPHEETCYSPKVRWVIPQKVDHITFIGRDILVIAYDIYIIFLNLKTHTEIVYVANDEKKGDGVDSVAGHRTYVFAFSEKVKNGRIFIMNYPSFTTVAELKDPDVNRYKGLVMMECELVAGFSGFPNYLVSVWNYRTHQRLLSIPTGVVRRNQIYMASRTHMLICECYGEGLVVWEVAQCYKKNLILRRAKPEVTGWEVSEPPLIAVCWNSEGQLYAIDPDANLYSVLSDGIGMVTNLEWPAEIKGQNKPCLCSFGAGLLIYGPDDYVRSLKKTDVKWKVVWQWKPLDIVTHLVSNATCDMAAMWTNAGICYRISGESEEKLEASLFTFKHRNIKKVQMIAPEYKYIATMCDRGMICIYEALTAQLVGIKYIDGEDIMFEASPVNPLLAIIGEVGNNYGIMLAVLEPSDVGVDLRKVQSVCLTHQIVSRVVFSPTGRELVAAAMFAGHVFIYQISEDYKLTLVRYAELGRGLANCMLMRVGDVMRCFSLVLFSDKYCIGERIVCINAETGKDNKFAGKMAGPYAQLVPLSSRDTMLAVPHLSSSFHVLQLSGEKGVTVSVKMGPIVETGHQMKQFNASYNARALLTFGYDGTVVVRSPDAPKQYELKLVMSHRYESGLQQALIDSENEYIVHLAGNKTVSCLYLHSEREELQKQLFHDSISPEMFDKSQNSMTIINAGEKNYLDLQEDKKVHEEAMNCRKAREEVVRTFENIQSRLVELLEENIAERPLHQLSLSEFNLHHEHRKERLKQAERDREELRLKTEARIRAQDKVTSWIRSQCWDTMLTPRVKLFAIFSHYQVENYPVLPTQRDLWPELQQTIALRAVEMENDHDMFRPWEESLETDSDDNQRPLIKSPLLDIGHPNKEAILPINTALGKRAREAFATKMQLPVPTLIKMIYRNILSI